MVKPNYHRDIWVLGPATSKYPGSFPRGFVDALKRKWWGQRRLWVCSGGFHDSEGICLDIRRAARADVLGNAETLPFKDECFDFVMADPPYSEIEAQQLYGLPYLSIMKMLNEMYRVCEPNGLLVFYHRLIPGAQDGCDLRKCSLEAIIGTGVICAWSNIRTLSVWRKRQSLESFEGDSYG